MLKDRLALLQRHVAHGAAEAVEDPCGMRDAVPPDTDAAQSGGAQPGAEVCARAAPRALARAQGRGGGAPQGLCGQCVGTIPA